MDDPLRRGVLVDPYAVVRRALQAGGRDFLEALDPHHGYRRRDPSVKEGGGSIVVYERRRKTRDSRLLDAIEVHNRVADAPGRLRVRVRAQPRRAAALASGVRA